MLSLEFLSNSLKCFFSSSSFIVLSIIAFNLVFIASLKKDDTAWLTQEPARFLATIQVAITLSGFLGSIRLSDIEDAIGVTFTEECDTFTRFVFQKFGMVPKDGDTKIELEIENMHIIIDKIKIIQYYIGGLYIVGLYRHKIH